MSSSIVPPGPGAWSVCPVPGCHALIPHGHQLCTIHDRAIDEGLRREAREQCAGFQAASSLTDVFAGLVAALGERSAVAACN